MNILDRAYLRNMDLSHLELILRWRNQEDIRKFMFCNKVITLEEHKNWFQKVEDNKDTIVKVFYLDERPIGIININHIDYVNKKCYWGFYIGNLNAPKGSGTLMGYLALKFIFEELRLRKLCAEVIDTNERSIYFHKKFGFLKEGTLRKHVLRNNVYSDVILMALFADQWNQQSKNIKKRIEGMVI